MLNSEETLDQCLVLVNSRLMLAIYLRYYIFETCSIRLEKETKQFIYIGLSCFVLFHYDFGWNYTIGTSESLCLICFKTNNLYHIGFSGLTNIKCHEKFKSCIKRVQKSGKVGFSQECPYSTAVPTMVQGMDLAIKFSQFSNSKFEL